MDVIPIGSDAVQLDKKFAVFDIPFLFSSREQVSKLLDGPIGEELDKSFQSNAGLKVLGYGEIGFRQITNNVRPIVKPDDLKEPEARTLEVRRESYRLKCWRFPYQDEHG